MTWYMFGSYLPEPDMWTWSGGKCLMAIWWDCVNFYGSFTNCGIPMCRFKEVI